MNADMEQNGRGLDPWWPHRFSKGVKPCYLQKLYSALNKCAYGLSQCGWPLLLPTADSVPMIVACINPTQEIFNSLFHFDCVYTKFFKQDKEVSIVHLLHWHVGRQLCEAFVPFGIKCACAVQYLLWPAQRGPGECLQATTPFLTAHSRRGAGKKSVWPVTESEALKARV